MPGDAEIEFLQQERPVRISTPLGEDVLGVRKLDGSEHLGKPFLYQVDCVSVESALILEDLLGQPVTLEIDTEAGTTRYLNGIVSRAEHTSGVGEFARYLLTIRPWIWLLEHTSDCRIFQDKSTPDIIQAIFSDQGLTDFELRLNQTYLPWNYRVQYDESDFNFVSRLMEHEGIYYYFRHENGKHTLVLCDGMEAHEAFPGYETIPHFPADTSQQRERDHLVDWSVRQEVLPGAYALKDFSYASPKGDLLVREIATGGHAYDTYEVYDYPGALPNTADGSLDRSYGEQLARRRMGGIRAGQRLASARGNAKGVGAGNLFTLENCERQDQNREYLIVEASLHVELGSFFSGEPGAEYIFVNELHCIPSDVTYRSPQRTPKPRMSGPQTAIVVGKKGEEIWTDSLGRVKLQFHWDRYGKSDEVSSCWIRVSQSWAGEKWGSIHIPRIGQEVIVDYVDGDPDRPLVTGRVYNGDNGVPYELTANATQSGIKSRSSKNGSKDNFNEIRMEDKKGSEELYFHAEKDQTTVVENDRNEMIGRDHSEDIGRDCSEKIGRNRLIEVGTNHTEKIGSMMSITVGGSKTELVSVNSAETVSGAKELTVGGATMISVGGNLGQNVGGDKSESVGSNRTVNVGSNITTSAGASMTIDVGAGYSLSIAKDQAVTVGGKSATSVDKEYVVNAKKIQLVANDEITLKTGSAEIIMKKNGDITIKGKKISVKGSGDVVIKGSKILGN